MRRKANILIASIAATTVAIAVGFIAVRQRILYTIRRNYSQDYVQMLAHATNMYRVEFGTYPAASTWKHDLVSLGFVPEEFFTAPGQEPDSISYIYRPPPAPEGAFGGDAGIPIVWEHPDLWNGRGITVGYGDGRVQWITGEDLDRFLKETTASAANPPAETPAPR